MGAVAEDLVALDADIAVLAVQERLIWVLEVAEAVNPVGTEGGVVSRAAFVVALAMAEAIDTLPAASKAETM